MSAVEELEKGNSAIGNPLVTYERMHELAERLDALEAENEALQRVLLRVRVAMGLHRDSNDDLIEYADRLRAELFTYRDAQKQPLAQSESNALAWMMRCLAAEEKLAAAPPAAGCGGSVSSGSRIDS